MQTCVRPTLQALVCELSVSREPVSMVPAVSPSPSAPDHFRPVKPGPAPFHRTCPHGAKKEEP
jgi:hypothetical protein